MRIYTYFRFSSCRLAVLLFCLSVITTPSLGVAIPRLLSSAPGTLKDLLQTQAYAVLRDGRDIMLDTNGYSAQPAHRGRHSREEFFSVPSGEAGNIVFQNDAQDQYEESFQIHTRSISGGPNLGKLRATTAATKFNVETTTATKLNVETITETKLNEETTAMPLIMFSEESVEAPEELELRSLIQTPRKTSKTCKGSHNCGRSLSQRS